MVKLIKGHGPTEYVMVRLEDIEAILPEHNFRLTVEMKDGREYFCVLEVRFQ